MCVHECATVDALDEGRRVGVQAPKVASDGEDVAPGGAPRPAVAAVGAGGAVPGLQAPVGVVDAPRR